VYENVACTGEAALAAVLTAVGRSVGRPSHSARPIPPHTPRSLEASEPLRSESSPTFCKCSKGVLPRFRRGGPKVLLISSRSPRSHLRTTRAACRICGVVDRERVTYRFCQLGLLHTCLNGRRLHLGLRLGGRQQRGHLCLLSAAERRGELLQPRGARRRELHHQRLALRLRQPTGQPLCVQ